MLGNLIDLAADALSLPLRAARIPSELVLEFARILDPRDDAAIRTAAEQLAGLANVPLDVAERAIRGALGHWKHWPPACV